MNSNNYRSLEEAAKSGQMCLEKMSFEEAEEAFRLVLDGLTSTSLHGDRLRATSLVGLAEIYVRRCRNVNDDVQEWLRSMLCAFALYKDALENWKIRSGNGREESYRQQAHSKTEGYFKEILPKCYVQMKVIEDNVAAVLKREITNECMKSKPGLYLKKKVVFEDDWLQQLMHYCITGRRSKASEAPDHDGTDTDQMFLTVAEEKMTASSSYIPVYKRKIDFDRLQEGIRRIVSEVSTDVRSHYLHFSRHIPGPLLQRRLYNELTLRLSPGSRENDDLLNVLDEAVQYEDCSEIACDVEVESRRSCLEEFHRISSKARKDLASELESVEEEEEDEREVQKKEDEKDEYGQEELNDFETIELRLDPSAIHSDIQASRCGDSRSIVVDTCSRTSASRNDEVSRRHCEFSQLEHQSRKQKSDTRYGNSVLSDGGQSVGGISGAFCMSGILTLWRSARPHNGNSEVSLFRAKELHNFEEVSPLTERDKVLRWLQSVEPEPRQKQAERDHVVPTNHPSGDKVGQAIGHVALRVADAFQKESKWPEAYEVYKYSMGIFQVYPLAAGQTQMMADLLLRVGTVKCSMGQLATGSQLMEESVGMLERSVARGDDFRIAEVWFQIGNVYLADKIRQESLQARIMQLIRNDIEADENQEQESLMNVSDKGSENSDQGDSYCLCIYEAMTCYKRALTLLNILAATVKNVDPKVPELTISVLSNMADCYVMTGNLDMAEIGYEEALHLFPETHGTPLLTKNAHVLSMLGTVSFLLRNFVRAATMYETSHILQQHLQSLEDPSLEMAWTSTMLGLSYSSLFHYDKAVVWCIRAFTLYTRFFRGQILDVDHLCRWFIVQTLYVLGFAYITLDANDKALYYLNLAKNMTTNSGNDSQDVHQLVQVLRAIADAYSALEKPDKALLYYEEALHHSKSLGDENTTTALRNQLLNRMAGANVDSCQYNAAGDNLEQALDYQRDVQSSIKDDMIAILLKLGVTSTIACDIDKAIGCYTDCVQAYSESRHKTEPADVASVMTSLGTLCHVKGCMQDDDDDVDAFMDKAEQYFEEAFQLTGSSSPFCVQYANFLYQQGRYADALLVMLPYVFCRRPSGEEICYNGIEQAVLPDHLHYDADDEDTLLIEARVFAKFLAVLCYGHLDLVADADDALVELYMTVALSSKAFSYVILGYGLMEMCLFQEAAESFMAAARLQPEGCRQTFTNACLCFLLYAYVTVARAVDVILEFLYDRSTKDSFCPSFEEKKHYLHISPSMKFPGDSPEAANASTCTEDHWTIFLEPPGKQDLTMNNIPPESPQPPAESDTRMETESQKRGLQVPSAQRAPSEERSDGSDEFRVSSGGQAAVSDEDIDREDDWEEWTTEEVIVETPREILELIANQLNRNRNLNGQTLFHPLAGWNESSSQIPNNLSTKNTPETQELNRTNSISADASHRLRSTHENSQALDNAAYTDAESNGWKPEVGAPEVNGNKKEDESYEEWVMTEEIIETPAEIIALLRKNYCN